MTSLIASKDQLAESALRLSANWSNAKGRWADSAREDFENSFWQEFETTTVASIDKLQELIDTIARAEREIR